MSTYEKWGEAVLVSVDKIEPNPLNPNRMAEDVFKKLVEQIEMHGFDEPLQVVQHPDKDKKDLFLLVGGEHRWKAAKILGMQKVPCVIKTTMPDDLTINTEMVRRNMVRGELDNARFNKLIKFIKEKAENINHEEIAMRMGFSKAKDLERLLQKELENNVEKAKKISEKSALNIIDNTRFIIEDVFSRFGDTVPFGFIFFSYKNRLHLLVQTDDELYELTQCLVEKCKRNNMVIVEYLKALFIKAAETDGWPKIEEFCKLVEEDEDIDEEGDESIEEEIEDGEDDKDNSSPKY